MVERKSTVLKPNYQYEKRQREMEKKKKKAEKADRKASGIDDMQLGQEQGTDTAAADVSVSSVASPIAPEQN